MLVGSALVGMVVVTWLIIESITETVLLPWLTA
jgi:hypothetical protein